MSKVRVYVVEDEALIAMELQDRLAALGFEPCGHSTRAEAALEDIPRLDPDLVLMDVNLAGAMSGVDAACLLRERRLPVILVTAYSRLRDQDERAATFPTLTKPFRARDLEQTIRRTLDEVGA
jgi:CheY-like chemotaxis protein